MVRGFRGRLMLAAVTVAAMAVFAASASALLVKVNHGRPIGVTPVRGATLNTASVHVVRRASGLSTTDNLTYNGGPVMHGVTPYLIFWDPSNQLSAANKALFARFFADSAHDSGLATNVWGVDRQFTDTSGFADYSQSWSAAQEITDTQPYPASGQCSESSFGGETACLYDSQLQDEVQRLISADGLPDGTSGQAPLYFIVTPPTVNTCFSDNQTCADNYYCAYHSVFTDSASNNVLYADIPTVLDAQDPKGCQYDGQSAVQAPNGSSSQLADVALKAVSHEMSETITDPVNGSGWYNVSSGQEDGDQCNFYGTYDPSNDNNPNAFTPTLGGSSSAGTLFNQSINGNPYYIQSEWSNGDGNCEMHPTANSLSAAFSSPATVPPGGTVTFNPSASSNGASYSSTTWDFGDGHTLFATAGPTPVAHTYPTAGTYTVTLTLVDAYGNLSKVSHQIAVTSPTAAFSTTTANPTAGSPVAFDGSASSEPGGSIRSYAWSFGDGATGSGATLTHTYAGAGTDTVTLTVTDASGYTSTVSSQVVVAAAPPPPPPPTKPASSSHPAAAFVVHPVRPVAGVAAGFSAGASTDVGSSLTAYAWSFGDGHSGSGLTTRHRYGRPGRYHVTLTVTDAAGQHASATRTVIVRSASITTAGVGSTPKAVIVLLGADGPGTLIVGGHRFRLRHAATVSYRPRLTAAQRSALGHHRRVRLTVRFRFVPVVGKASGGSLRVSVRR